MPNVDYDDVARVAREAVPGETVEARIVDGEGVVVSVEPGCGEGGEDLWRVSYVAFVADEPREESPEDSANGPGRRWRAKVTYQQEHEDAYEAGKEAGELMTHLPKPAFFAEAAPGADDPVGRRAWEKRKLEKIRARARREVLEELVDEARRLKAGEFIRPREESVLHGVLKEIGLL